MYQFQGRKRIMYPQKYDQSIASRTNLGACVLAALKTKAACLQQGVGRNISKMLHALELGSRVSLGLWANRAS